MKKSIVTLGLLLMTVFFVSSAVAQDDQPAATGAMIEFEKTVHDYGKIQQNANGQSEFVFKNTGTEPLILSMAKGSCGCTVPEWPREPIAPGASSAIKVKYATNRIGIINKTVTITSNAVNEPTKVIKIKGEVLDPAAGATPEMTPAGPVNN